MKKNILEKLIYKDGKLFEMGSYSYGVTLFGGPSIVIPCGSIADNFPFGIQIISKKNSDLNLIDIAFFIRKNLKKLMNFALNQLIKILYLFK